MISPESKPLTIELCAGDSSTDYEVTTNFALKVLAIIYDTGVEIV